MANRFYNRLLASSKNLSVTSNEYEERESRLLRETVHNAYANAKFWRDWMDRAKIKPHEICSVKDLSRIPLSSKEDLMSRPLRERLAADPQKCVRMSTSGTTGEPMEVYYSRRFVLSTGRMLRARHQSMLGLGRMYKWLQISYSAPDEDSLASTNSKPRSADSPEIGTDEDPRARRKRTLGLGTSIVGPLVDRFLRTVYISRDIEPVISKILKFAPDLVSGNSYYLKLLSWYIEKHRVPFRPAALLSTGGPLDEPSRKFLESKIPCPTYQMYGSSEIGPVALECRSKRGMHIFADRVIVEVLSMNGEHCEPGELGEIVVTGLSNHAMPLIRYRMRDIGSLSSEQKCECGNSLPKLASVEGREIDHIVTPDGRLISPKKIMTLVHQTDGLPRCQLVQSSPDSLTLRIFAEKTNACSDGSIERFFEVLRRLIGSPLNLRVSLEDEAKIGAKLRPIVRTFSVSDESLAKLYVA